MTTQNIRSAAKVLSDFLEEQAKDEELDGASVSAIIKLRDEGKLTRTNLLRQLEAVRNTAFKGDGPQEDG